jgi:serine protease AprX
MKNIMLICLALLLGTTMSAQDRLWIMLSDKGPEATQLLEQPETFLSEAALARRAENGIAVSESDLPVRSHYIEQIQQSGATILGTSRWLNAVAVEASEAQLKHIDKLCFVTSTRKLQTLKSAAHAKADDKPLPPRMPVPGEENLPFEYGDALLQNTMLNIDALHAKGMTGKGVRIALFDSGFDAVDTMDVFDSLWANNQIVAWYDFVDNDTTVFREDDHGTNVMSTIGANLPGEMVGMAPHATFLLARTEDAGSETKQEEHNWVAAVEWADSLGADVIHSSLGYSEFDQDIGNYTYDDMDGNTAVITRAADLAASKGIIVTTSAGNEGNGSWHYITAPCDGDSVLCAGAITKRYRPSSFSSWGPSSDGRVKPDVTALGSRTTVASRRNYITASDGTSFSGPLIGGLVACLRQAHPDRSNIDIINAVRMSGDQYNSPDDRYGYGIPDAAFADSLLANVKNIANAKIEGRNGESRPEGATIAKKKPAKKIVVFTDNPQSAVSVDKKNITITTPKMIRSFKLMRGEQEVILNPKNVKEETNEVIIKKKYLLPGEDYYLNIKTGSYEENIKLVL